MCYIRKFYLYTALQFTVSITYTFLELETLKNQFFFKLQNKLHKS